MPPAIVLPVIILSVLATLPRLSSFWGTETLRYCYATYREVVTPEDASSYFQILPKCVQDERKTAAERRVIELDQAAKKLAEERSNCGRATKDEYGSWVSVMDEDFDQSVYWDNSPLPNVR